VPHRVSVCDGSSLPQFTLPDGAAHDLVEDQQQPQDAQ
jgi:hypothetical protein